MSDFKPLVYEWDHGSNRYVTPGDRVECLKERVVAADDYVTMKEELRAEVERLARVSSLVLQDSRWQHIDDAREIERLREALGMAEVQQQEVAKALRIDPTGDSVYLHYQIMAVIDAVRTASPTTESR